MGRRNRWKKGDWLVQDVESGFVRYASEVGTDDYGVLKLKSEMDSRHPQEFVKSLSDPYPVDPVNPPFRDFSTAESVAGLYVGETSVLAPVGPATHIFRPAIGTAIIEYDFFVY